MSERLHRLLSRDKALLNVRYRRGTLVGTWAVYSVRIFSRTDWISHVNCVHCWLAGQRVTSLRRWPIGRSHSL